MKRTKIIVSAIIALLIIILPFITVITVAIATPPQYSNTFVGELSDKFDRLNEIDEPKIVLVGGSALAFGVDSKIIEKYTEMPVVNFGLYAALGTKLMLDLSRSGINRGDIILICPELEAQTYSLYFNSETTLQAMDGNFEMLFHVGEENFFPLLSGMWKFAKEKLSIMKSGDAPNPDGVYNSKNFNEYGDLVYPRKNNVMSLYYDENVMINPDVSIISEDFIDYINDYVSYAKLRGASVYFGFAPMNEQGILQKDCLDELAEFEKTLKGMLDCPVISNIKDYVYEAGYFYDTNFHLNDAGKIVNTVNLTKDLLLEMGKATPVKEEIPAAPKLPGIEMKFEGEDENAKYFTYEKAENGAYKITGLSELGKSEKVLTLPLGYNGVKVLYVGDEAFVGGVAEKIILPENSNIRAFTSYAFNEASALRDLWIYYPIAEDIMPADFSDMPSGFKIHIPPKSNYDFDYNWGPLSVTYVKDAVK
jgi:hypothetical protein